MKVDTRWMSQYELRNENSQYVLRNVSINVFWTRKKGETVFDE